MTNLHQLHHRHTFGNLPRQPPAKPTPILGGLSLPSLIPSGLIPGVISSVEDLVPPISILPLVPPKESTSVTSHVSSTTSISSTTSTSHSTAITSSTPTTTSSTTTTSSASVASTTSAAQPVTRTSFVYVTSSSTTSIHPSATGTAVPSSGVSAGKVVGGVGGAIVGVVALIVILAFFLRRSRQKRDDITDFDPVSFRRSAVVLDDPPTHEDTVARGFNPRPPTMIERRLAASPALSFGTIYGAPGPAYNHGNNAHSSGFSDNQAGIGSHLPSPYMNKDYEFSPSPVHPMFAPAIYNQSPMHTPISPYNGQLYDQQNLARQPPMGANERSSQGGATYPVLTRQPSAQSSADGHSRQVPPSLVLPKESAPANDYVDLSRSSVSPYQAAQYAEISRRLNTDVPQGLPALDRDLPPVPPESRDVSPFDDPESVPPSPGAQFATDNRNVKSSPRPKSGESVSSVTSNALDFPAPPSPEYTVSSRYRIDSTPPSLPEISVESRASMIGYSGLRNVLTVSNGQELSGGLRVTNQKFPTTPSPLASSFGIPFTPDVKETTFAAAVSMAHSTAPPPTSAAAPNVPVPIEKKRATTYSLYDTEDAYGGI